MDAEPGLDLYGEPSALAFAERLRPTLRFDSVEPLIAQIDLDVVRTRELLDDHPGG